MKKIAVLVAPGFEEIELLAPVDILRRLELDVQLIGVQSDSVTGAHNVTIQTDSTLAQLNPAEFDALILPGGAASWVLRDTPEVIELVKQTFAEGKLVAAICAAPIALAKAGIVAGKKVTAYPMDEVHAEISEAGGQLVDTDVAIDNNLITGRGPAVALAFGYALGEYLATSTQVAELKSAMCY